MHHHAVRCEPTFPSLNDRRVQLANVAAYHRVPATYSNRDLAEAGGLMSYGTNIAEAFRQVGAYTRRILKGAKPADLPVVQASKFEFVINLQTARMLGLTVPARGEPSGCRHGLFREPFKKKRCLMPVSGYYEWEDTLGGKQPHYFTAQWVLLACGTNGRTARQASASSHAR
jgi:hypothetical protein